METITLEQVSRLLFEKDNFLILMHKSPDGDAVGSGYALCMALRSMGKKADTLCGDPIPEMYRYFTDCVPDQGVDPEYIISVDLATTNLLCGKAAEYKDRVDLCIDHHGSNTSYAKAGYVDGTISSCAEIIKYLFDVMQIEIDKNMANAIFTGICTDTGCFKYSSVSPQTHRTAADLMELGADSAYICHLMFDSKSKSKIMLEKFVLETLEFFSGGKVAFVLITKFMMEQSGALECDTDGISSMPRQIEGVKIGITMREKDGGEYRFSVRTSDEIDASAICKNFGGGGHKAAAGCSMHKSMQEAKDEMLKVCISMLEEMV